MAMIQHVPLPDLTFAVPQIPAAFASLPLIRGETAADVARRERLLDEAFGPSRFEKTCERLREGRLPARGLSLVAEQDGEIVGTLRFWHVRAGDAGAALLLGPLAVATDRRARGLGARLMAEGLFRAISLGHRAVLLVGDAPYYERFGFGRACVAGLNMPGPVDPTRFLGLELREGALAQANGDVVATGAWPLFDAELQANREHRPAA